MYSWKDLAEYVTFTLGPKSKRKMSHLTKEINSEAFLFHSLWHPAVWGREKCQSVESVKEVGGTHVSHNGGMQVACHFSLLGLPK